MTTRGDDLGHEHFLTYFSWAPDRDLNPQYDGIADVEKAGSIIDHPHAKTGNPCSGAIHFDVPGAEHLSDVRWQVESWDPLTISPSVLCACGDHGFVRNGRWEPA